MTTVMSTTKNSPYSNGIFQPKIGPLESPIDSDRFSENPTDIPTDLCFDRILNIPTEFRLHTEGNFIRKYLKN